MTKQYPSKEDLLQIADAAAALGKAVRYHWFIRGASQNENPARTLLPKNSLFNSNTVRIHFAGMLGEVAAANTRLKRLLTEVEPAQELDDMELALLGRKGGATKTFTTVAGWPYVVSGAIGRLQEARGAIAAAIGHDPADLGDVQALEAAAGVLRGACGELRAGADKRTTPARWFHSPDDKRPEQFCFGPLTATGKALDAAICNRANPDSHYLQLKGHGADGRLWIVKRRRFCLEVWFLTEGSYRNAKQRLDAAAEKPRAKTSHKRK